MLIRNFLIHTLVMMQLDDSNPWILAVEPTSTSKAIKSRCLHAEKNGDIAIANSRF